jgi:hypothetical protein
MTRCWSLLSAACDDCQSMPPPQQILQYNVTNGKEKKKKSKKKKNQNKTKS